MPYGGARARTVSSGGQVAKPRVCEDYAVVPRAAGAIEQRQSDVIGDGLRDGSAICVEGVPGWVVG
jgi:hypothetical protein